MIAFILTITAIFIVLVLNEFWCRKRTVHGEFSRKFVHISVGSFVAFWPYFLSPNYIKLMSIAFLLVVLVSKYFKIFQAIHAVQRPTLGEVWFAIVVGGLAFTVPEHPHIYTAALLMMSLADGLAAVVGTHYGSSNSYSVFGYKKSFAGSTAFFVVACAILIGYAALTPSALPLLAIAPIALAATVLENVAVNGYDNLVVAIVVAGALLLFV